MGYEGPQVNGGAHMTGGCKIQAYQPPRRADHMRRATPQGIFRIYPGPSHPTTMVLAAGKLKVNNQTLASMDCFLNA